MANFHKDCVSSPIKVHYALYCFIIARLFVYMSCFFLCYSMPWKSNKTCLSQAESNRALAESRRVGSVLMCKHQAVSAHECDHVCVFNHAYKCFQVRSSSIKSPHVEHVGQRPVSRNSNLWITYVGMFEKRCNNACCRLLFNTRYVSVT